MQAVLFRVNEEFSGTAADRDNARFIPVVEILDICEVRAEQLVPLDKEGHESVAKVYGRFSEGAFSFFGKSDGDGVYYAVKFN